MAKGPAAGFWAIACELEEELQLATGIPQRAEGLRVEAMALRERAKNLPTGCEEGVWLEWQERDGAGGYKPHYSVQRVLSTEAEGLLVEALNLEARAQGLERILRGFRVEWEQITNRKGSMVWRNRSSEPAEKVVSLYHSSYDGPFPRELFWEQCLKELPQRLRAVEGEVVE